jgi:zinc protease
MSLLARLGPALAVLLVVGSACSLTRGTPAPPPAASVPTRHVLPNGVRVVVQEFRTSEVTALQLWVRAGGRDEAASELGLAHYLEHMLFKGTTTRPRGFVEREVEGVGGRINAGTSLDFTYYHTVLPAARTLAGIELLADVGVNSSLDPTELELEKKVVLEEMRLSEDSPRRHLVRDLYGQLFEGHPYGRPVLGTAAIIRGLTRETLMSFYRRHYVPESFTLVVVGPVNPGEVLEAARRTFGRIPRADGARLPMPGPQAPRPLRVETPRPGTQAYLALGWHAPRLAHAETPVVDLLVAILGHSRPARLPQALRERLALVNTIGAGYSALEAAGAVTVTAQLEPANLARVEREILGEIQRVREAGVTAAELARVMTAAEARHAFSQETAEGRAFAYGRAETVWRLEDELAYVDRLHSVTREQVQLAARRYLDPARYTRLTLVPGGR